MFAKERQDLILEQLNQKGKVLVKDLSIQFDVTEDCIRKDLSLLEKNGLLQKTYGGAMSVRHNPHHYKITDRKDISIQERQVLAKKAFSLINDNDTIYLDISLSNVDLCYLINESSLHITVMTNMIEVLNLLSQNSNVQLIFIGGSLNQERDGFWGSLSLSMLQSFKIDKAFLGVVGVDIKQNQLTTYHHEDGFMKHQVIEQSTLSYILCEDRKFKEVGNYVYASIDALTGLIINEKLSSKDHQLLIDKGLIII